VQASSGSYLYAVLPKIDAVLKIGSGLAGTSAGKVYACSPQLSRVIASKFASHLDSAVSTPHWVAVIHNTLLFRGPGVRHSCHSVLMNAICQLTRKSSRVYLQVPSSACLKLSCDDLTVVGEIDLSDTIDVPVVAARDTTVRKLPSVVVDTTTPWKSTTLTDNVKAECVAINATTPYKQYSLAEMRWSHIAKTRDPKPPVAGAASGNPVTTSGLSSSAPTSLVCLDEDVIGVRT
jgi:hypothetical protein